MSTLDENLDEEMRKKVLLVDDEPDILEFLSYNLEKEGYKVFTAGGGKDAIEIAKQETPDLIVLDVMMPEMDGIETCHELKEINSLKNTVIIFFSISFSQVMLAS